MSQVQTEFVDDLRTGFHGTLFAPGEEGYDEARRVWNGDIDRRPAVVARCADTSDVAAAVRFAVGHGLEIAVRGGGHGIAGMAVVDDGVMIDLSRLNSAEVDPAAATVRVGGGALLGDLDAATQAHGLAVPAGVVSHTGVGGLTLGGGMGLLTRQAGLTIDNLVGAEVVTADGQILQASEHEHPDLFWALRGGGGNFGIVTEFVFRCVPAGPMVTIGMLFWDLEHGAEMLRAIRDIAPTLPPEIGIIFGGMNAPPEPFVPEQHRMQPGYGLVLIGFGSDAVHAAALDQVRAAVPPLWEFISPIPYVALQQMMDEANAWGFHCYDKGTYLEELTDGAIEAITEYVPQKASPLSVVLFYRLDGAYSAVPDEATAFSGLRSPRYAAFIVAVCPDPGLLGAERRWVRDLWNALQPFASGAGSYVNAVLDSDEEIRASYGSEKYARLAKVKAIYDPDNVFRRNANIAPA
ncbi:MAG TPA: FAD-binding oxidoreductase [Sporichthya sp.]|nr:FAD-binding oxidoreductase [Sporichthya sp.]